jgi:hypothetical protein
MASVCENGKLERIVFASYISPDEMSAMRFALLAESIRTFAGGLSQTPIWCLMLDSDKITSQTIRDRMSTLDVSFINAKLHSTAPQFPFMRKVLLSAYAESLTLDETCLLVWMDNDTIVLQEPKNFALHKEKSLGCSPVHISNIGSLYNRPLNHFWKLIYEYCRVPPERVFPIMTHVDGNQIRPYFNAGLLVVRPKRRLFQSWRDNFLKTFKIPDFQGFFEKDQRYSIFMHQAVLAGTILSTLQTNEIELLPKIYNYPLHLYQQDAQDRRPSCIEELITLRYEDFFGNPEWKHRIPAHEHLKQWIAHKLR